VCVCVCVCVLSVDGDAGVHVEAGVQVGWSEFEWLLASGGVSLMVREETVWQLCARWSVARKWDLARGEVGRDESGRVDV